VRWRFDKAYHRLRTTNSRSVATTEKWRGVAYIIRIKTKFFENGKKKCGYKNCTSSINVTIFIMIYNMISTGDWYDHLTDTTSKHLHFPPGHGDRTVGALTYPINQTQHTRRQTSYTTSRAQSFTTNSCWIRTYDS